MGSAARSRRPAVEPGDRLDRGAARLDVAQHLAGRFDQRLAGGGRATTRRPTRWNSARAELRLELADRLGDRGLGDVLGFRGAGHPAVVDHRQEQSELSEIHRYSLWNSTVLTSWTCGFGQADDPGVSLVLIAAAGVGIGFAFGLFGAGGSAFGTPILALLGVPAPIAIASPLPAMLPAALMGAREYFRAGVLDRRIAVLAVAAGVPMALLGAMASRVVSGQWLLIASGLLLLGVGIRMVVPAGATATSVAPPGATGPA